MGYITTKIKSSKFAVTDARCDECGERIHPVYTSQDGSWINRTGKDALDLRLLANYGTFFDGNDIEVLLCKHCANKLIATFKCMGMAINHF